MKNVIQNLVRVIAVFIFFVSTANANSAINVQSFNGDYAGAISGVGGKEPVHISGILTFNGDGTGFAKTLWHIPAANYSERLNIRRDYPFTYTVDADGIALLQAETFADIYFVVTKSKRRRNGRMLALEIQGMAGRLETSGANIMVGTGKRLPNRAYFDQSSLYGLYAGLGIGDNQRAVTAVGYIKLYGNGSGREKSLWNIPDPALNIFNREIVSLAPTFTYEIDPDGIGRGVTTLADGTQINLLFVVTESERKYGRYIATEIFFIQEQLDPVTGDLLTTYGKRLDD